MISRKLDHNGDIATSGVQFVDGRADVAQTIATRLKLFTGECFRDINEGMPWFRKPDGTAGILNKGYSLQQTEALIIRRISATEGVIKLLDFKMTFNSTERTMSVYATVLSRYGVIDVAWEQ